MSYFSNEIVQTYFNIWLSVNTEQPELRKMGWPEKVKKKTETP